MIQTQTITKIHIRLILMNEHRSVTKGAASSSSQNPRRNDEGEPPAKKSSKELR